MRFWIFTCVKKIFYIHFFWYSLYFVFYCFQNKTHDLLAHPSFFTSICFPLVSVTQAKRCCSWLQSSKFPCGLIFLLLRHPFGMEKLTENANFKKFHLYFWHTSLGKLRSPTFWLQTLLTAETEAYSVIFE